MTHHLAIDPDVFRERFGRHAFMLGHRIGQAPLFGIEELVALAQRLPPESVEFNGADVPRTLDPADTPRTSLDVAQTLRSIEVSGSWVCLKNVERHPPFRALLHECLAEVRRHSEAIEPGLHDPEAFVFVSSPGAVTPFHLDPEQNFLLQIRGRKTLHVFDAADRAVVSEEALDRFFGGAHRNLAFRDEFEGLGRLYTLGPGVGLHIPVAAPHWVQNGPEVSVSFSLTFQTRRTARLAHAHRVNARLRGLGMRPRPVGVSAASDELKYLMSRAQAKLERARQRVFR